MTWSNTLYVPFSLRIPCWKRGPLLQACYPSNLGYINQLLTHFQISSLHIPTLKSKIFWRQHKYKKPKTNHLPWLQENVYQDGTWMYPIWIEFDIHRIQDKEPQLQERMTRLYGIATHKIIKQTKINPVNPSNFWQELKHLQETEYWSMREDKAYINQDN